MREVLASIDIGSSKIKLVVGEMLNGELHILCALDEESRGVKKGIIVEPSETEYAVKKLMKKAEDLLGVKISKVITSINEDAAEFKIGEASISITSPGLEVGASDIIRVLDQSIQGKIVKDYELVTVIPIMFKVDDHKTRMPKNMRGSSLSVKSVVVSLPKRDIYNVAKVLERCGLEVIDISLDSIGSFYAHSNETHELNTGIMIDVGAETIKVAVFNKGIIINNLVLGIGGSKIDDDLQYIYKITDEQSKKIKEKLALANKKYASKHEKESIINTLGEKIIINQLELTEFVMGRLQEVLNMAKNEINYLTKKEISYIIISGGLSEMRDFPISVESVFGRIATVGKLNIVGARDNKYAACIGMLKYFDSKIHMRDKEFSIFSQDELEQLVANGDKKSLPSDSILGKIFGIFFDN